MKQFTNYRFGCENQYSFVVELIISYFYGSKLIFLLQHQEILSQYNNTLYFYQNIIEEYTLNNYQYKCLLLSYQSTNLINSALIQKFNFIVCYISNQQQKSHQQFAQHKSAKMSTTDQSLQNKQKYLRDKILQKGHDAQAFMAYCQQKYGEIDLEGWSFNKLKQIVKGFLGDRAEMTFTQDQLQNGNQEQWAEYVQQEQTVQSQSYNHNQQPVMQHKVQHKKQLVFSDADWEIFGLGQPTHTVTSTSKKQINLAALQFTNVSNLSMSPPSDSTQKTQSSQQVTSIPENIMENQSFISSTFKKQVQIEPTPAEQFPSPTMFNKKNSGSNQNSGSKQFQQLKREQISQVMQSNNKITQIGSVEINVIPGKHLPPLPQITDIKVIKTEQKTRNFLQGDYTLYHIQFLPCNHVIQRKFNDFRKLRTILQKLYPHLRLPYLQPEGWLVNSSQIKDQQTQSRYKYMIQQFLKYSIIRNDLLKKSKIMRIFTGLLQSTPTDFKKYENIAKPKQYSQLCLPSGKLTFSKYQNLASIDKYMTSTHLLSGNVDTCYQKLRKSMETLFYNYQHVAKSLIEVAGVFQTLETLVQKFNFDNDGNKDIRVFQGIKEVCMKLKQNIEQQYQIFKSKIQPLFKYERDNMTTIKQTNETRTKFFNEYYKQGLHSKKSSEYLPRGDTLTQGSISIEQPNKTNKNILTIQNMFWSHFTYKNAEQYWAQLRYKINQQLTIIAYDQLDGENRSLNFWNAVIKKCVM